METTTKKTIFERLHFAFDSSGIEGIKSAMKNGEVGLFGVHPSGAITEDYDSRGELFQRDVSKTLAPFFSNIHTNKNGYMHVRSLNKRIDIFAPSELLNKEIFLEWAVLSGIVDAHTQLEGLAHGTKPISWNRNFFNLRNALNGENSYNMLNMAIDFKYGIVITRSMTRLSVGGNICLAEHPINKIKTLFDLYITDNAVIYDKKRLEEHYDEEKAKALALAYIRQTFFS